MSDRDDNTRSCTFPPLPLLLAFLTDASQKRRAIMVDLAIGLGLPALQMMLREFCPCCQLFMP